MKVESAHIYSPMKIVLETEREARLVLSAALVYRYTLETEIAVPSYDYSALSELINGLQFRGIEEI